MSNTLHLVCPHCHAVNRVPQDKLDRHPSCGKCHLPMFHGRPVELDAVNFNKYLSHNDIPVLVDFWAPWCGPCRTMAPAFEQAAALLEPQVRLVKVNTEIEEALAGRYAIRSIPTLALFSGGREVARQSGAMGAQDIVRWARSVAGSLRPSS
jgi:thioredoxin 2